MRVMPSLDATRAPAPDLLAGGAAASPHDAVPRTGTAAEGERATEGGAAGAGRGGGAERAGSAGSPPEHAEGCSSCDCGGDGAEVDAVTEGVEWVVADVVVEAC